MSSPSPHAPHQRHLPCRRWHLVCRVIDNFGDVGVMWRLARQLRDEHGIPVDFFIDQPDRLRLMAPEIGEITENSPGSSPVPGNRPGHAAISPPIRVHRLDEDSLVGQGADVIVAGFQARLPEAARRAVLAGASSRRSADATPATSSSHGPLLIQLDYLSAEAWIDGTHGLPSRHPDGLEEWFFNPGFGRNNGGLLIEHGLLARRDAFQADPAAQREWLRGLGVQIRGDECLISVLAYPGAPLQTLLAGWPGADSVPASGRDTPGERPPGRRTAGSGSAANGTREDGARANRTPPSGQMLHLLIPGATTQPRLLAEAHAAAALSNGRIRVSALPFLPQAGFDRLLWCCDLNLVRGEDSWIRALWAGRPWLWHVYPQTEDTHLDKLDAFVARVRALFATAPAADDAPALPQPASHAAHAPCAQPALPAPTHAGSRDMHELIGLWHAALRVWNGAPDADDTALSSWLHAALHRPAPAAPGMLLAGRVQAEASDLCSRLVAFAASKPGKPL